MSSSPLIITGTVKLFIASKGYGFIRPDDGGGDVFLHVNVLREYGQSSIAEDVKLELEVEKTDRGFQAVRIIRLLNTPHSRGPNLPELAGVSDEAIELMPFLPARLKWFDRQKGFGFATLFGDSRDAFLHIDVVHHGGMEQPAPGEALALRVMKGKRGLIAIDVMAWDHVPSEYSL